MPHPHLQSTEHTYTVSITSVFLIFICLHSLDMLHKYCYDMQKHVLKPTIFCGLPTQEPLQISVADEQCDLVYSVGTHRKLHKLHLTQVKWGGSETNTVKWTWKAKMSPAQIPDSRQSMQNYILIYTCHKESSNYQSYVCFFFGGGDEMCTRPCSIPLHTLSSKD